MMLCGLGVRFNLLLDSVLGGMGGGCGPERGQLLVGVEPLEALGRLQHGGRRPAQCHRRIAPSLHIATDAAHRSHRVLDAVGGGERAPKLGRQAEAVDGEDLFDPFPEAGGDAGRLALEPAPPISTSIGTLARLTSAP
jgi:hypothetical protein